MIRGSSLTVHPILHSLPMMYSTSPCYPLLWIWHSQTKQNLLCWSMSCHGLWFEAFRLLCRNRHSSFWKSPSCQTPPGAWNFYISYCILEVSHNTAHCHIEDLSASSLYIASHLCIEQLWFWCIQRLYIRLPMCHWRDLFREKWTGYHRRLSSGALPSSAKYW